MEEYEQEKQLIDYLNVIWKRKWLIVIPTFILCVAVGIYSFLMPDVWEVDSIILPSKFIVQTEQGQFQEVLVADPSQISSQINQNTFNNLIAAELNINIREFPELEAEKLKDTNLIRISLKTQETDQAKTILLFLFNHLKSELDKKIDVEIKSIDTQISSSENLINLKNLTIEDRNNAIKIKKNDIKIKKIDISSREIEKTKVSQEIQSAKNKQKISEERVNSIIEEMKSVKKRIDDLEEQQKKVLEQSKEGIEAISLLLYSSEVQQNFRYYNTLDEKINTEKISQENLNLLQLAKKEEIKQLDTQIEKLNTEIDNLNTQVNEIKNDINKIRNEIEDVNNQIALQKEKKGRIDYAKMIKAPTSSLNPVAPKKKRNVMLAGIIGLMIFSFLAFFLEYIEEQKKGIKNG